MIKLPALPKTALASLCAILAVTFFSINDMLIKFLSGGYALHQIVLLRSTIGMIILLAIFMPISGSFSVLKTKRLGMHLLRGSCVVFANLTFFQPIFDHNILSDLFKRICRYPSLDSPCYRPCWCAGYFKTGDRCF